MGLKRFLLVAAMAVLATVSCNKDEGADPSESVAGTYSGYSTAEFQYSPDPMVSEGQTLTITSSGEGIVTVSYVSDTWGQFTVSGARVSKDGDSFTIGDWTYEQGKLTNNKTGETVQMKRATWSNTADNTVPAADGMESAPLSLDAGAEESAAEV